MLAPGEPENAQVRRTVSLSAAPASPSSLWMNDIPQGGQHSSCRPLASESRAPPSRRLPPSCHHASLAAEAQAPEQMVLELQVPRVLGKANATSRRSTLDPLPVKYGW